MPRPSSGCRRGHRSAHHPTVPLSARTEQHRRSAQAGYYLHSREQLAKTRVSGSQRRQTAFVTASRSAASDFARWVTIPCARPRTPWSPRRPVADHHAHHQSITMKWPAGLAMSLRRLRTGQGDAAQFGRRTVDHLDGREAEQVPAGPLPPRSTASLRGLTAALGALPAVRSTLCA